MPISDYPASHEIDAHLLEADGYVYLYDITLTDNTELHLKANNDVTWQGKYYSGTAIQLSERSRDADGKLCRPNLTLANPSGVYSAAVSNGYVDYAKVVEKKVLLADITANNNIYLPRSWRVFRYAALNRLQITLELRSALDFQRFNLPFRSFTPDEGFPSVSL